MSGKIVVIGSLNMDLVIQTPRLPHPGETILGNGLRTIPGGKGANQAAAAARLGAEVAMVGCVGRDEYGRALLHNLGTFGVQHSTVCQHPAAPTGIAVILVDDAGKNNIVVISGANMELEAGNVQQASTLVAAADLILLQLEIPLETVCAAAELAHDHHVPVILNPAPAQSLPSSLLAAVDYLVLNETELSLLADTPIHSISEAVAAARALVDAGSVIFTMGARGSLLITQQDALHIPAFDVDAIDTTAAGDAFIAGFATSLAEGQSMEQAICWGNAAGGLATTILGAQPSLPHRHDVYQLVQSRQHRSQSEKVGGEI